MRLHQFVVLILCAKFQLMTTILNGFIIICHLPILLVFQSVITNKIIKKNNSESSGSIISQPNGQWIDQELWSIFPALKHRHLQGAKIAQFQLDIRGHKRDQTQVEPNISWSLQLFILNLSWFLAQLDLDPFCEYGVRTNHSESVHIFRRSGSLGSLPVHGAKGTPLPALR